MSMFRTVPAPMGRRLLAYLVDSLVLSLLAGVPLLLALVPAAAAQAEDPTVQPNGLLVALAAVLALAVGGFQWWYQGTHGWTLGKRLVGIRTLSAETGRPIGMVRVLVRYLVIAGCSLVPVVGAALVFLSPFFDATGRRQGWHDRAAGDVVLDVWNGRDPSVADESTTASFTSRVEGMLEVDASAAGTRRGARAEAAEAAASAAGGPAVAAAPAPGAPPTRIDPWADALAHRTLDTERLPTVPVPVDTPFPVAQPDATVAQVVGPVPAPPLVPTPPTPAAPRTAPVTTSIPAWAGAGEDVESTRMSLPRPAPAPADRRHPDVPWADLALSDGRRVTVAGTALLGRNPAPRAGESPDMLLPVIDMGRSVSKTHLAVGVDVHGPWVVDRRSTNGTVVTLFDGQQILCAPEQTVRLATGATVSFGDYAFTVLTVGQGGEGPVVVEDERVEASGSGGAGGGVRASGARGAGA